MSIIANGKTRPALPQERPWWDEPATKREEPVATEKPNGYAAQRRAWLAGKCMCHLLRYGKCGYCMFSKAKP